jgi:Uma2 family endonuclease
MATVVRIGPQDHDRLMTYDEFLAGDYEEGFRYELIDGRLYVSPEPNFPQDWVLVWLHRKLDRYAEANPNVLRYVTQRSRVFVAGRHAVTAPEPDLAAYKKFPSNRSPRDIRWQDVSPVLVVEILSEDDPDKDIVRNVQLYREVPSIREYWIVDGREEPEHPTMTVYRRRAKAWRPIEFSAGQRFTTSLLPGFELVLDTRS